MSRIHLSSVGILMALFALGCAGSPDIVQVAPDTYRVTKEDRTATDGKMPYLKADAIKEADEFARKQGKVAVAVSEREVPVNRPVRSAYFEYTFRLSESK